MERKILLYGQFGRSWWDDEGITAKGFFKELEEANKDADCDSILVCINSPGGSIGEGVAIYNQIIAQNNEEGAKPINTRNDGIAYSMGGICLTAGKKVSVFKNSSTMLHCCSGIGWGNVKDLESTITHMKAVDKGLANSIASKSGKSLEDVEKDIMNYEDHFYTSDEALEANLIDEIIDQKSESAEDFVGLSHQEAMAKFAEKNRQEKPTEAEASFFNKLKSFMNSGQSPKPNKSKESNSKTSNQNEDEPMKIGNKLTALLAVFGLSAVEGKGEQEHTPTAEQLDDLNSQLEEVKTLKDQVSEKDQQLSDKDTKISDLEAKVKQLEDGSGAKPQSGANGDATKDGGESETFESGADEKLKAMRAEMGFETKNED